LLPAALLLPAMIAVQSQSEALEYPAKSPARGDWRSPYRSLLTLNTSMFGPADTAPAPPQPSRSDSPQVLALSRALWPLQARCSALGHRRSLPELLLGLSYCQAKATLDSSSGPPPRPPDPSAVCRHRSMRLGPMSACSHIDPPGRS
jgi:hypothetical protein